MSRTVPVSRPCRLGCLTLLLLAACRADGPEPASASQPPPPPPGPEMLGAGTISTAAPEFATSVSADGTEVFFNRANADRSKLFILVSRRQGDEWTEGEALPFSDGTYRDVDPFVTEDGTSERPGVVGAGVVDARPPGDLYRVRWEGRFQ